MGKIKLKNINYKKFEEFLNSDKNEIEFFNCKNVNGEVISLEEYLDDYYEKTQSFLEAIKPEVTSIMDKNKWVKRVGVAKDCKSLELVRGNYMNGQSYFVNYNQNDGKINCITANYFYETPDMVGNILTYVDASKLLNTLKKNSSSEIVSIYNKAGEVLDPIYKTRKSVSSRFVVTNSTEECDLIVGRHNKKLFEKRVNKDNPLGGSDYFTCLSETFSDFKGKTLQDSFLKESSIKVLEKKICVVK